MNTIKKLIFPLSLIVIFASCKSNSKDNTRNIQLLSDSSAYHNSATTDSVKGNALNKTPNDYRYHSKETVKPSSASDKTDTPASQSSTASTSTDTKSSTSSDQSSSSTTTTQKTTKKGWSKAAQGAVIGGAAGAVGGAIISKHKGTGAAIGAAVGAASGYIIGKDKDKKDKK